ncbi:TPA_asm: nucleoside deaminase [Salmonella enterica]|nr:nucleoside deaminase [Salmonella enterica]EAO7618401.1 nucleoside deaminase [Salmonella enterica]EAQ6819146.1 nucleoside deaminase [Salmonella enterica]EAU9425910.1 nucleoside deaminase [Salmonella enterica]EBQ2130136.1 nucleoside deaminase [Salmonella enterica]
MNDVDSCFALACKATVEGMQENGGGPFGATLVRNGEVVCTVGNTVLKETDISGHAEMVAVREACKKLNTLDLSDCTMYATCEPCPMCSAVMIWAGIKTCYYASTHMDAAEHGFSDQHLRDFLDGTDTAVLNMIHIDEGREDCAAIWEEFRRLQNIK